MSVRILVDEPDAANRALLQAAVRFLGHQPVPADTPLRSVAAMVFDPAAPASLAAARSAREDRPDLPLVCISERRRTATVDALGPSAYVMKPFTLAELREALEQALR